MSLLKKPAVVFYARDFLSKEFPRMALGLTDFVRIYIVVSETERSNVSAIDGSAVIYCLSARSPINATVEAARVGNAFNNDRYLRSYSAYEIARVVTPIVALCDEIAASYEVRFYLDEPVSGYPNLYFNTYFTELGAKCLHFQTSWIPGYMFFSTDPAHERVPPLNEISGGSDVVAQHIEARASGGAVPLYVLNYSTVGARVRDAAVTAAKWIYRQLFRRREYYLDSDGSAHVLHIRALLGSFRSGYLGVSAIKKLAGKYVLYPLHYEPESILNYFSAFSRQEEIVEQIIDSLPLGYELILKEHPSQPGALNLPKWRRIARNRRVLKVRGDVSAKSLLQYDVAVVSIGSTLAIESALAGRPVGVLGKVHFASMPGITHLQSPRELDRVLATPAASRRDIEQWYGAFLDAHCFRGNIMKDRTTGIDLSLILSRLS